MTKIKKYLQNHWALKTKKITNEDGTVTEYLTIDTQEVKYAAWKAYSNLSYRVKKFFKPWNRLTLTHLPNEYHDRDYVMFHAVFQCLVDFVELEHPYVPWDCRDKLGNVRFTDIKMMREYVLFNITPKGLESYYAGWESDEEKARTEKHVRDRTHIDLEILYLYEWYTLKRYQFNDDLIFGVNLCNIFTSLFGEEPTNKGNYYLTSQEYSELEEEHKLLCDHMLRRVLAVRHYLWT